MSTMSARLDASRRDQLAHDGAEYPAGPRPRVEESGASLVRRGLLRSSANDEDRAEARRLVAELLALADVQRKPWLGYVRVDALHLGAVLVGCNYTPGDGAIVTSASTEPPQHEDITVEEVWLRGVEISPALNLDMHARIVYAALVKARAGEWA